MDEKEKTPTNAPLAQSDGVDGQSATPQEAPQDKSEPTAEKVTEHVTLFKRKKRNGKFISKLDAKTLDALQRRKSLFMYLSTLFFAVTLFLKPDGRARLAGNDSLFAVFTLYVLAEVALIVLSVLVSVFGRTWHKIGPELKEKNVPQSGLDGHTFWSYEIFNALHMALACGEIAVSLYDFDVWGALNIAFAVLSAAFCLVSRQILFKANAGQLEYLPAREE